MSIAGQSMQCPRRRGQRMGVRWGSGAREIRRILRVDAWIAGGGEHCLRRADSGTRSRRWIPRSVGADHGGAGDVRACVALMHRSKRRCWGRVLPRRSDWRVHGPDRTPAARCPKQSSSLNSPRQRSKSSRLRLRRRQPVDPPPSGAHAHPGDRVTDTRGCNPLSAWHRGSHTPPSTCFHAGVVAHASRGTAEDARIAGRGKQRPCVSGDLKAAVPRWRPGAHARTRAGDPAVRTDHRKKGVMHTSPAGSNRPAPGARHDGRYRRRAGRYGAASPQCSRRQCQVRGDRLAWRTEEPAGTDESEHRDSGGHPSTTRSDAKGSIAAPALS